jgi:very-short-patch-repair endonuclease
MQPEARRALIEARWPPSVVATTDVLAAAGITDRALTEAVRARRVLRIRRGAYLLASAWNAAKPWEKDLYRIDAHAAARATPATYSHTTAARLLGCSVWDAGTRIHITVPYASSARSHSPDVAAHRQPVGERDLVELLRAGRLIRLTSIDRTVADCARILDLERAAIVGDHALRRGASVEGIAAAADRSEIVRGSRRVERLLAALDVRAESPGETRTRLALAAERLPTPELQFEVMTEEGLYRADFAWPELKVILEFDGESKYFAYRPTAEVLLAERRRENALAAAGWVIIRIRWADLGTPDMIAAKVRAAFSRAAKLAG